MTLYDMAKPNIVLYIKVEQIEDGIVYNTPIDGIWGFATEFGNDPLTGLNGTYNLLIDWQIYENVSGHVGTTRITLTHQADIVPLKWTWDYNEVDLTFPGPGPDLPQSTSLELTGSTVTQTFAASGALRSSNYTNISNVVFQSPI